MVSCARAPRTRDWSEFISRAVLGACAQIGDHESPLLKERKGGRGKRAMAVGARSMGAVVGNRGRRPIELKEDEVERDGW